MSKLWGGNRKGGDQTPVSTVRGKISAPIPIPTDDDELPERMPVVGLAIPFGYDTADIAADDGQGTIHSQTQTSITQSPPRRISPQRLSGDELRRSTTGSRFRESGLLSPLASPPKPERRKGSFRAALGRLFGKKPKGERELLSNGQAKGLANHKHHKSVRISESNTILARLTRIRIPWHYRTRQIKQFHPSDRTLCPSTRSTGGWPHTQLYQMTTRWGRTTSQKLHLHDREEPPSPAAFSATHPLCIQGSLGSHRAQPAMDARAPPLESARP
jgi:hypothetical protein